MAAHSKYSLNQSRLYGIGGMRKLAEVLLVPQKSLHNLQLDSNYRKKRETDAKGKVREMQVPIGPLRILHDRIQVLFSRLETPEYLHSGVKGRSSITNARAHLGKGLFGLKLDISSFFPSCRVEAVADYFRRQMRMSREASSVLAQICTFGGHIPTGSPLSGSLAFLAYKRTFDAIYTMARMEGITFTLYVDDMIFSSLKPIPQQFALTVKAHLRRQGLRINGKKTAWAGPNHAREVTGSMVLHGFTTLKVPHHRGKKAIDILNSAKSIEDLPVKLTRSVIGQIQSGRQSDPAFMGGALKRLKESERRRAQEELALMVKGVTHSWL